MTNRVVNIMATFSDFEDRFSALLKPIRNLTENWNINLASYLEDYLSELEHVEIIFDDGKTTMNFAEAALLIQGSACIYSKKVEFLYNLVVQMLELLQNKRKAQENAERNASNMENGNQLRNANDEDDDFVPLDDIVIATNIVLKDEKSLIVFLKKPPICSLTMENPVLGLIPLYSELNEVIGKREDFQILSLHFDDGMTLLHGESSTRNVETDVKLKNGPCLIPEKGAEISEVQDFCADDPGADFGSSSPLPCPLHEELPPEEVIKNKDQSMCKNNIKDDDLLCSRKGKKLELQDPFEAHPQLEKEFKKGSTFKILPEILNSTRPVRLRKPKLCLADYCKEYYSASHKLPKNRRKRPKVLDCENLYLKEHKLRMQNKRSQKSTKQPQQEPAVNNEDDDCGDGDNGNVVDYCPDSTPQSPLLNDVHCPGEINFDVINAIEDQNGCHGVAGLEKTFDIDDSMIKTSYEKMVQQLVEDYMTSSKLFAQQSELARKVNEWEQRIAPRLEVDAQRSTFDIHEYGTKVLNAFAPNNRKQTLLFSEIVSNADDYEIARYFSAVLQLANSYNIQISKDGVDEAGDRVEVTLLSCVRHHEQLNDYVAPSTESTSKSS